MFSISSPSIQICRLKYHTTKITSQILRNSSSKAWLRRQRKDPYVKKANSENVPSRAFYKLQELDQMASRKKKHGALLFRKGQSVIDLGAAPGGWSLYASQKIGRNGILIGIDLLQLDDGTISAIKRNCPSFQAINGDFNSLETKETIIEHLYQNQDVNNNNEKDDLPDRFLMNRADLVISDMAPNFSGDQTTDALKTISLCEESMMFAAGSSCFNDDCYNDIKHDNVQQQQQQQQQQKQQPIKVSWQEFGLLKLGGTFLCKFFSCGPDDEKDLLDAAKRLFGHSSVLKPKASRKESAERYLLATGFKGCRPMLTFLNEKKRESEEANKPMQS